MAIGRPVRRAITSAVDGRSAIRCSSSAVLVSCQTIARPTGTPVCRFQTHGRLALVGHPERRRLLRRRPRRRRVPAARAAARWTRSRRRRAPPSPGRGIVLVVFALGDGDHPALPVEQHAAGGRGALVERRDVRRALIGRARGPSSRRDRPARPRESRPDDQLRSRDAAVASQSRSIGAARCRSPPRRSRRGRASARRCRPAPGSTSSTETAQPGSRTSASSRSSACRSVMVRKVSRSSCLPEGVARGRRVEGEQDLAQRAAVQRQHAAGLDDLAVGGRGGRRGGPRRPHPCGTPRCAWPRPSAPRACPSS